MAVLFIGVHTQLLNPRPHGEEVRSTTEYYWVLLSKLASALPTNQHALHKSSEGFQTTGVTIF